MTFEEWFADKHPTPLYKAYASAGWNAGWQAAIEHQAALESRVLAEKSQGEKAAREDVRTARYEWMLKMLAAYGWTERGIDKEIAAIAGEKK